MKRILIFSTFFFGIENDIRNQLLKLNIDHDLLNERYGNGFFLKAINRFKVPIFHYILQNLYYLFLLANYDFSSCSKIVFINPETVPKWFINSMKAKKIRIIVYVWDSVQNKNVFKQYIDEADVIYTFDRKDADKFNMIFRPLFFSSDFLAKNKSLQKKEYLISFIGSDHSDRIDILEKVQAKYNNVLIYLFSNSIIYSSLKYFLVKQRCLPSFIYKKKLPSNLVREIMANSESILDIEHPSQSGLTSRVLNALASNIKVITTNEDIKNYPFYNPNHIHIIDRKRLEIPESFIKRNVDIKLPEYYSISSWVKEVIIES